MNDQSSAIPNDVPPPPLCDWGRRQGLFGGFSREFVPLSSPGGTGTILDALLKRPARITHELIHGGASLVRARLFLLAVFCIAAYGLIVGSFSGGHQYWAVPTKLVIGLLLSGAICFPSLYILTSLSGSDRTCADMYGFLLQALALSGTLLLGFAPIAWLFSQSTNGVAFMGFMHVCFWLLAAAIGLRLLSTIFEHVSRRPVGILKLWGVIFVIVTFQMCTTLRPLVGPFDGKVVHDKQFFLQHWTGGR